MSKTNKYTINELSFERNVFRYLDENQKNHLITFSEIIDCPKNKILYLENTRPIGVYLILSGIIKIYKTNQLTGKQHIIKFAKKDDLISFRSVISNELLCTSAKAVEHSLLLFVPSEIFLKFLNENHQLTHQMLVISCQELRESNKFITDIALKTIKERLAEILIFFYNNYGIDENGFLRITINREDIASIVGTATESVIRQLSEFKKEGLIDVDVKKIKILNIKKLKSICL